MKYKSVLLLEAERLFQQDIKKENLPVMVEEKKKKKDIIKHSPPTSLQIASYQILVRQSKCHLNSMPQKISIYVNFDF